MSDTPTPSAAPEPQGRECWWLLECGHYGRSRFTNTVAEASGTAFVYVECGVCPRDVHGVNRAKRRRVKRV